MNAFLTGLPPPDAADDDAEDGRNDAGEDGDGDDAVTVECYIHGGGNGDGVVMQMMVMIVTDNYVSLLSFFPSAPRSLYLLSPLR